MRLELPHVHAAISLAWLPQLGQRVHIFKLARARSSDESEHAKRQEREQRLNGCKVARPYLPTVEAWDPLAGWLLRFRLRIDATLIIRYGRVADCQVPSY